MIVKGNIKTFYDRLFYEGQNCIKLSAFKKPLLLLHVILTNKLFNMT